MSPRSEVWKLQRMRDLLLHNWHLKLVSIALAAVLWAEVARTPTSEIGVSVSLEYQNFPEQTEVYGDMTDRVEVRLRGPSASLRTLTPQDISLAIDMRTMTMGEKVLPLSPEMVHAPFGIEVVRVLPSRVKLTVEPTATKLVRIAPVRTGIPETGFEVQEVVATPDTIQIEGPASRVLRLESVPTTEIDVTGKSETFSEMVDLDILDPVIRIPKLTPIQVEVRLQHKPQ